MKKNIEIAYAGSLTEGWSRWAEAWEQRRSSDHLFQLWEGDAKEVARGLDTLAAEAEARKWPMLHMHRDEWQQVFFPFSWVRQALMQLLPIVVRERPDIPLSYRHVLYALLPEWWKQTYGGISDGQELSWLVPRTPSPLDLRVASSRETCLRLANGTALFWQEIAYKVQPLQAPWTIVLERANQLDRWSLAALKRFIHLARTHPVCLIASTSEQSSDENCLEWADSEGLQAEFWERFLRTLPIQMASTSTYIPSTPPPASPPPQEIHSPQGTSSPEADMTTLLDWCDAVGLLRLAARQIQTAQEQEARAQARFTAARGWILEQHYTQALTCLVTAFHESANPVFRAECAIYAGVISANHMKDSPAALGWVEKGLQVLSDMQEGGEVRARGWLHNVAALAYYRAQSYKEASKELKAAMEIARTLEEEGGVFLGAALAGNLSLLYEAMGLISKAFAVRQRFAHALNQVELLVGREFWYRQGYLLWKLGEREKAEAAWENAYMITNHYLDEYISDWIARAAACAWSEVNAWGRACYWAERSLRHARAVGDDEGEVRSLLALALLHQLEGDPGMARHAMNCAAYQQACRLKQGAIDDPLLAHVLSAWSQQPPSGDATLLHQLFPRPTTRLTYPFQVFDL